MKSLLIIFAIAIALGSCVIFGSYVHYYNLGNTYETTLSALQSDRANVLANYTTKVMEVAQVPKMYKKDLSDVIQKTFEGRYGKGGSKAVFQFIKENNMTLDPKMYRNIQEVMESGRDDFMNSQRKLIDVKRSYKEALGSFWGGMWLHKAGYPKMNLDKIKVIINKHTQNSLKSGMDEGVNILK